MDIRATLDYRYEKRDFGDVGVVDGFGWCFDGAAWKYGRVRDQSTFRDHDHTAVGRQADRPPMPESQWLLGASIYD